MSKTYPIITISRQYGSGGREIGRRLAEELGIPYYDYEIIAIASRDSGIAPDLFERAEDTATNSLLFSMARMGTMAYNMPLNDQLFMIQSGIIRNIADRQPAVIVGRCADYVLSGYTHCVDVFVRADWDVRVKEAMKRKNIVQSKAEEFVKKADKRRATYHNYYTDRKWGMLENYDISVNSGAVGLDASVKILKDYVLAAMGDELEEAKKTMKK